VPFCVGLQDIRHAREVAAPGRSIESEGVGVEPKMHRGYASLGVAPISPLAFIAFTSLRE
jgi:hypothetical protein